MGATCQREKKEKGAGAGELGCCSARARSRRLGRPTGWPGCLPLLFFFFFLNPFYFSFLILDRKSVV